MRQKSIYIILTAVISVIVIVFGVFLYLMRSMGNAAFGDSLLTKWGVANVFSTDEIQRNARFIDVDGILWGVYEVNNGASLKLSKRSLVGDELYSVAFPKCSPVSGGKDTVYSNPFVAQLDAGLIIVSWTEKVAASINGCYAKFDIKNKKFLATRLVSENLAMDKFVTVPVGAAKQGSFEVFWTEKKSGQAVMLSRVFDSGDNSIKPLKSDAPLDLPIFYYSSAKTAAGWEIPIMAAGKNQDISDFDVTTNVRGGVTIVLSIRNLSDSSDKAYMAAVTNNVDIVGPVYLKTTNLAEPIDSVTVGCSMGGSCLYALETRYESGQDHDIVGQVMDTELNPIIKVQRLNREFYYNQLNPSIVWNNQLGFVMTYESGYGHGKKQNALISEIIDLNGKYLNSVPEFVAGDPIQTFHYPKTVSNEDWIIVSYDNPKGANIAFQRYRFNDKPKDVGLISEKKT